MTWQTVTVVCWLTSACLLVLVLAKPSLPPCYETISHQTGRVTVNCSNLRLTAVPNILSFTHVHTLDLSGNQLSTLTDLPRLNLTHLRYLDVSQNSVRALGGHAFLYSKRLQNLRLGSNGMARIHPDGFLGLVELCGLRLDNNRLRGIPSNVFVDLRGLRYLDLSRNFLTSVPSALWAVTSLRVLDLSSNRLVTLTDDSFMFLCKLRSLRLRSDCNVFEKLERLEVLDLSHNNLTDLELHMLPSQRHLKELILAVNSLHSLYLDLEPLVKLELLDLSYNNLTTLLPHERKALNKLYSREPCFSADCRDFVVKLEGNPLECSGSNIEFLSWWLETSQRTTSVHRQQFDHVGCWQASLAENNFSLHHLCHTQVHGTLILFTFMMTSVLFCLLLYLIGRRATCTTVTLTDEQVVRGGCSKLQSPHSEDSNIKEVVKTRGRQKRPSLAPEFRRQNNKRQPPSAPVVCRHWQTVTTLSSGGGDVRRTGSDVILQVPPDAVRENHRVDIHIAVCADVSRVRETLNLSGCEHVASPLAEYWAGEGFSFQTPVVIALPHCLPANADLHLLRVYCVARAPRGGIVVARLRHQAAGDSSSFTLSSDGKVLIKTTHFSGYVCTYCGLYQGPPTLKAVVCGSVKQLYRGQHAAHISTHVWDRRLNIADFRQEYGVPFQGDVLQATVINLLEEEGQPPSWLHFRLEPTGRERCLWQHSLRANGRLAIPVVQRRRLDSVLSCDNSQCVMGPGSTRPVSVHWSLETPARGQPAHWLQCVVDVSNNAHGTPPSWIDHDNLEIVTSIPVWCRAEYTSQGRERTLTDNDDLIPVTSPHVPSSSTLPRQAAVSQMLMSSSTPIFTMSSSTSTCGVSVQLARVPQASVHPGVVCFRPAHTSLSRSHYFHQTQGPKENLPDVNWQTGRLCSASFGAGSFSTSVGHPFGTGSSSTSPGHPFGTGSSSTSPGHPFGTGLSSASPAHPFGTGSSSASPAHPFGTGSTSASPAHPFGTRSSARTHPQSQGEIRHNDRFELGTCGSCEAALNGAPLLSHVPPHLWRSYGMTSLSDTDTSAGSGFSETDHKSCLRVSFSSVPRQEQTFSAGVACTNTSACFGVPFSAGDSSGSTGHVHVNSGSLEARLMDGEAALAHRNEARQQRRGEDALEGCLTVENLSSGSFAGSDAE